MTYEKPWSIYVITYKPTGKKYVGKTTIALRNRLDCHLSKLRRGVHASKEFQEDYNRFGGDICDFDIELYGVQYRTGRRKSQFNMEHHLIIALKTYNALYGYNTHDPAMQWIRRVMGLVPGESVIPESKWASKYHQNPNIPRMALLDYSKLRGKIKTQYGSCKNFADALGIHKGNLSAKLNGRGRFTPEQIEKSCRLLGITSEEINDYFFVVS